MRVILVLIYWLLACAFWFNQMVALVLVLWSLVATIRLLCVCVLSSEVKKMQANVFELQQ